jgi:outer membrane protein assembly factor BamB
MKRIGTKLALGLILAGATNLSGYADDWPQWLGPDRSGISRETLAGPIAPSPRRSWTNAVGLGSSSIAVSQGRAFTLGHVKAEKGRGLDSVFALDALTGNELWRHAYECASCWSQDVKFDGPRSTPTVDGDHLYALSLEGHLFCLETATGRVVWSKRLTQDLGGRIPVYGYCCSPLVYRELLILELNAPGAPIVALNKQTGEIAWRCATGEITCGSPVLTRLGEIDCAVVSGGGKVMGVNAATGELLWQHRTWGHAWMGPVVSGKYVFMANASMPRGCGVIEIDALQPRVLWEAKTTFQTLHCNSLIWQGHVFGVDNTGTDYQGADSRKSALKCLDLLTGTVKWTQEKVGWGNVVLVGGTLLLLRETGEVRVFEAAPDEYRERTRFQATTGPTWSAPALANGRLYCRNRAGEVACFELTLPSREIARGASPPAIATAVAAAPAVSPASRSVAAGRSPADLARSGRAPILPPTVWPRFRGPAGAGVCSFRDLPTNWNGQTGQGVVWKMPVPLRGPSSPVLWEHRLFLTGGHAREQGVFCYDTVSGKLLWESRKKTAATAGDNDDEETKKLFAAATPVIDGRWVHALFGDGEVVCLTLDGLIQWTRDLGPIENMYGHASSLERWRDLLLIQLDQAGETDDRSRLVALDASTGRTVWEVRRPVSCSWSSPVALELAGRAQLITASKPWVIAYNPDNGQELWRAAGLDGEVVPSPIAAAGLVFAGSENGRFLAIRPDGVGEVTQTHVVWSIEDDVPAICSPVSDGELVFLVNSGGRLVCLEAAGGRRLWDKDLDQHFQASPSIAGDRLYLLSDSGEMLMFKVSRQCEPVGRTSLGEPCDASPAFQPSRIYLRGQQHLFSIGVRD